MTQREQKQRIGRASDKFIYWIGSRHSLVVHTIFFAVMIFLAFSNIGFDKVMLVLTTIVSLEAIYLSIFIQMTVNKNREDIEEVSEDIDEIQKDVDEIQEDVEEIERKEKSEKSVMSNCKTNDVTLSRIEDSLGKLVEEVIDLKKQYDSEKRN